MDGYTEVDVSRWEVFGAEPRGGQPNKLWMVEQTEGPGEARWLFKPVTRQHSATGDFPKGEDWAEKVVAEVARHLGIPAARVELASRNEVRGLISRDVARGVDLEFGNELLKGTDPAYEPSRRGEVPGYTFDAVIQSFDRADVEPPEGGAPGFTAADTFAAYLLLDALVANTDRHHENWGLLTDRTGSRPRRLAPTFDHASSLGFQISDDERVERLGTSDANRTVAAFAGRGRSRHFAARPNLVALAVSAVGSRPVSVIGTLRERLDQFQGSVEAVVAGVPPARMSQPARRFAVALLAHNLRRLLDELGSTG